MERFVIPLEQTIAENSPSKKTAEWLNMRGLMNGAGTIQFDIAAATMREGENGYDKPLCDHNCDIDGGFRCPARRLANKGLNRNSLAPAEMILQAAEVGVAGLKEFNNRFVTSGALDMYAELFDIPSEVKSGIAYNLTHGQVTFNEFGGNAEMHPDVIEIAATCQAAGMRTNLTTTSGLLMSESRAGRTFLEGLRSGCVDVLAMSVEAESAEQIRQYSQMQTSELKKLRKSIPYENGQKIKALEAFHTLQLQRELGSPFPDILLNFVVHPGILGEQGETVEEIIQTFHHIYPEVTINPYLAESSFLNEPPIFSVTHIPALEHYYLNRLREQKTGDTRVSQRPHYIASELAVLEVFRNDPHTAIAMLAGYNMWKCYDRPYEDTAGNKISGAGSVLQIGASPHRRDLQTHPHAGGFLACFWNENTITRTDKQVWDMDASEVADYIDGGMQEIAERLAAPCDGCEMPRLKGAMHVTELGMNPLLKSSYLQIRKALVGF